MPPLLTYYSSVDANTAAVHAATLEEVTYAKVIKNGLDIGREKGEQAVNGIIRFFGGNKTFSGKKVASLAETVIHRSDYWKERSDAAVRAKVFQCLGANLNVDTSDIVALSNKLVDEAANGMGISEDLLVSQRAHLVADKFLEECIKGTQEALKKQGLVPTCNS